MFKKLFKIFFYCVFAVALFAFITNVWVVRGTAHRVIEALDQLPDSKVALVLGTSRRTQKGYSNPYFAYRIDAAATLYKTGKVKHLLLSGDNRTRYYNEPEDMKRALVAKGVPETAITLDYAGFRTLDSVVRCKKIFGQNNVIIITQKFHSYRALFISNFYDINAHVYVARNLPLSYSKKVVAREILARPKAVIDLFVLKKDPKFLGEEIQLNISSNVNR